MTILAKRIRCLTSFESGTESSGGGDASNPRGSIKGGEKDATNAASTPPSGEKDATNAASNPLSGEKEATNPTSHPPSAANEQRDTLLLLLTRDFRVNDNWALTYAYEIAKKKGFSLIACTCLNRKEKVTNRFIYTKLKILKNLEQALKQINIPFYLLPLYMIDELGEFIKTHQVKLISCDLHVLHDEKAFIKSLCHLCNKKKVKMIQVDAHNVVPMWVTSKVEECSVRTIKPKIQALLPTFLIEYVSIDPFEQNLKFPNPFDIEDVVSKLTVSNTCAVIPDFVLTEKKAQELLSDFCRKVLDKYNVKRNDPNSDAGSVLLPYVNLGVISAQRCVLEVHKHAYSNPSINAVSGKESFSDDFIMRKELADNYCYYNKNYDNFEGGRDWAKESLKKHDSDKREYLYDYEDFRSAKTHSDMWNCCQMQFIKEGIMHEFLKVFWAKKILNWSGNSQTALKYALQLNDEFSIDGKTPSGYISIMWSIMGVHDQSWNERSIFGKVRYINSNGCKRNFDMNAFMSKYPKGKENASIVKKIPTITFASYLKKRKNGPEAPLQESTRKKRGKGPLR
ncbi:deoxyribodipyrimidine photolyase [Plasmodium cynomolgi strain B]|uniref:Deoxyribodipyrimidine photo-lyase n=1 Tax=Plasmodium cynomolgi (strain B) TaxID=1120755 RepID=K6UWW8_PLACD|nr:deoxyribodipyrimidine photolyase [Plasmodium cynomolgi strain B]GAB66930.1 deoxyribodipyrimidine photolyase [Plasmodium cynomolgi strain B]